MAWAAAASDSAKLCSLLLFPALYPGVTLQHVTPTHAVSFEQLDEHTARACVYANASQPPEVYEDAAEHVARLLVAPAVQTLKTSALPEEGAAAVTRALQRHGFRRQYHEPCLQYVCRAARRRAGTAPCGLRPWHAAAPGCCAGGQPVDLQVGCASLTSHRHAL